MPKMKSHRSARKTFRVTASGKLKRHKMNRRHILTSKSTKRKRHLRRSGLVAPADEARIKRLMIM